jgi:hypothetical protein
MALAVKRPHPKTAVLAGGDDEAALVPKGHVHQLRIPRHSHRARRCAVHSKARGDDNTDRGPYCSAHLQYASSANCRGSTRPREHLESGGNQPQIEGVVAAEVPDQNKRRRAEIDALEPGIQTLAPASWRLRSARAAAARG